MTRTRTTAEAKTETETETETEKGRTPLSVSQNPALCSYPPNVNELAMRFVVLASGSKGNATIVETREGRFLIDCGLSLREFSRRCAMVGIDPTTISAILITHEHSDHIGGVGVIARRYQLPVYVNFHTATYLKGIANLQHFETGQDFYIGSTHIHPLAIAHDAVDPVGFVIREEGRGGESAECFAQVTDCGRITDLVIQSLKSAQAVVVEANHDEELLLASHYPWEVKQRIRSNRGHLSNTKAATLLSAALHKDLRTVVLAHLSEQCNLPELAIGAVQRGWHELITSQPDYGDPLPELVAASQHEPTSFFELGPRRSSVACVA